MPGADLGVALSVTLVPGVCVFAWTWGLGFGVALARPASGLCLPSAPDGRRPAAASDPRSRLLTGCSQVSCTFVWRSRWSAASRCECSALQAVSKLLALDSGLSLISPGPWLLVLGPSF